LRERKKDPSAVGDVVKGIFKSLEDRKSFFQEEIEAHWKELVGESSFKHSRPVALRKKVLSVRVDASVWLQHLVMRKREILKGLKRVLGKDRITEIHFRIGEF
jgi:predicted nucleic acid-binding Zn ribbon protein